MNNFYGYCTDCDEAMEGDGVCLALHCPDAWLDAYWTSAADEGPFYCGLNTDDIDS